MSRFAARVDQIFFKLYAAADRREPRDFADLRALEPTAAELRAAARWARTHNMPGPFDDAVARVLQDSGSRMTAAELRDEVVAALLALAWDQWSQLGVSAAAPAQREERAADPEALLLFTLEVGRNDPRLFDEVLDWLAFNEQLVSVHRLRNLSDDPPTVPLWKPRWTGARRRAGASARPSSPVRSPHGSTRCFRGFPHPPRTSTSFAQHSLARTR